MSSELEHAINQVYQKVGRNVVFFQKLESMLKRLIAGNQISGYVSEIEQKRQKQAESVKKQTLGQVAALFIEHNSSEDDIKLGPDDPKEPWISFGCKHSGEGTEERKKEIATLIEERNKLIHQFNEICDLSSLESCTQAEKYLDRLYDSVISEIRNLDCAEQALNIAFQALMLPATKDVENHFALLIYLQQRPSIMMLGKLSLQINRDDGWTILTKAEGKLDQEAIDEISSLKKQLNCTTLNDLLLKTEVFDLLEETTKKGGIRLLYRVKPDCSAWVTDNVFMVKRRMPLQHIVPRI
jgi:hypothetical protein